MIPMSLQRMTVTERSGSRLRRAIAARNPALPPPTTITFLTTLSMCRHVTRGRTRIDEASVKVAGPQLVPLEQVAEVEQPLGQDVNDLPGPLNIPVGPEQCRVPGGGAVAVINFRLHD